MADRIVSVNDDFQFPAPVRAALTPAVLGVEPAGSVATHAGAADPHPAYLTAAEGDAAYDALGAAAGARAAAEGASLPRAGGTLTGPLSLPSDPTLDLHATSRAYVLARIAALVDTSPAALDTLNELAAALGDDPNFAATMTTAIAGKAATTDPRLTDARIPTAHKATHAAGGSDALTASDVAAISGDTGTRFVTRWNAAGVFDVGALPASWKPIANIAGFIAVRRVAALVRVSWRFIAAATSPPDDRLWTATAGFVAYMPTGGELTAVPATGPLGQPADFFLTPYLVRVASNLVVDGRLPGGTLTYITDAPWPTVLPGVAA